MFLLFLVYLFCLFFFFFFFFIFFFFFFFQAEDGIRDWSVTGVQTCALPISPEASPAFFSNSRRLIFMTRLPWRKQILEILDAFTSARRLEEGWEVEDKSLS